MILLFFFFAQDEDRVRLDIRWLKFMRVLFLSDVPMGGSVMGSTMGHEDATIDGPPDGSLDGSVVGSTEGHEDRTFDGMSDGSREG